MDNWLFSSLFIVLCATWLWLHYSGVKSAKQHAVASPIKKPLKTYHGITIHLCEHACKDVCHVRSQRYLASEVPALPIYGCTNPECSCTYVHHEDRRSGDDRRYPSLTMEGVFASNEHRHTHKPDRRKQQLA
ncbi:MAG: hypothetical protein JKY93_12860 [Gammaproteobacteria bacterium]|nr:hypothetical protein [Gammaproteobacteria bacterium]